MIDGPRSQRQIQVGQMGRSRLARHTQFMAMMILRRGLFDHSWLLLDAQAEPGTSFVGPEKADRLAARPPAASRCKVRAAPDRAETGDYPGINPTGSPVAPEALVLSPAWPSISSRPCASATSS